MSYSVLDALSNPIRLQLVTCLGKKEKTVQELIHNCKLSQSAVSQHLIKLKQAKLVHGRKKGRFIYYSLTSPKTLRVAKEILKFSDEFTT